MAEGLIDITALMNDISTGMSIRRRGLCLLRILSVTIAASVHGNLLSFALCLETVHGCSSLSLSLSLHLVPFVSSSITFSFTPAPLFTFSSHPISLWLRYRNSVASMPRLRARLSNLVESTKSAQNSEGL